MSLKNITKIGTLGNDVNDATCSILAVKSLKEPISIVPFTEFELIVSPLLAEEIDAMVVPGAYPHISRFIMNELLVVANVFTFVIPPLVFGSKEPVPKINYETLYNHPATNPLIGDTKAKWVNQVNVSSNSVACLSVLQSDKDCCAITNSECAQRYGLYVHQVLRADINMPFVVFVKNRKERC